MKLVSKILVTLGIFAGVVSSVTLTSCGPQEESHTHTFAEEWTYDDTHHWHEATCEHSDEIDSYAEHTWDSGEVTTPAGCESDGVMTYTCTTCEATKTETILATGHSWDDGEITTPATCLEPGVKTYTCTVCETTKTESIDATGHSYSEEWTTNETYHWHEATCEHSDEVADYGEHTYENGVCTVCGMDYVSAGLEYSLHTDETCYVVTGRGTNLDTELVIPATHEGLPVKRIGERAFKDTNITNVVLPNSITFIGSFAFSDCSELVSINLPEGLQSIALAAFQSTAFKNIIIPASLSILEAGAFERCFDLESVRFANGSFISTIETNTFNSDASLQSVIIPAGVNLIQSGAFGNCYALQSVYYVGTQEGWNGITIESDNDCLTPGTFCSATIYYYSETQPTDDGNYWHYDTDGITPIVW